MNCSQIKMAEDGEKIALEKLSDTNLVDLEKEDEGLSEDDPVTIWRALEGHFEKRTTSRKLDTLRQLMELKMEKNGSVQIHSRKHNEIIADLQNWNQIYQES